MTIDHRTSLDQSRQEQYEFNKKTWKKMFHSDIKCGHCYGEGVCLRLDMKPGPCDQCKGTGYIKLKDNSNG